jgi:hypothetical protein
MKPSKLLLALTALVLAALPLGCGTGGSDPSGAGDPAAAVLPEGGKAGEVSQIPVESRRSWDQMAEASEGADLPELEAPPRMSDPDAERRVMDPTGAEVDLPPPQEPAVVEPDTRAVTAVTDGFEALAQNFGVIPPDTHGAVGPRHLVTLLNTQLRIQDKQGNIVAPDVSLSAFFGSTGHTDVFDPKILYDNLANRWVATADASRVSSRSAALFAISDTDDPTGMWTFYSIDADSENTRWSDFPGFGYNDNWYTITNNFFKICNMRSTAMATALGAGTLAGGSLDDGFWSVPMGFAFPFYGGSFGTAFISTNGYLTFGSGSTAFSLPVGNPLGTLPSVAGCRDDLNPSGGGTVFFETLPGQFVVTYAGVPLFGNAAFTRSFQIQLFSNGQVHIHYFGPMNGAAEATTTSMQGVGITPGGSPPPTSFVDYTAAAPLGAPAGNAIIEVFDAPGSPIDLEPGCLIFERDGAGGHRVAFDPPDPGGVCMKVIDKGTALAGGVLTVTDFAPGFDFIGAPFGFGGFTMKPTVHRTPGTLTQFLLDVFADAGGTKFYRLSRLTGTPAAPVWSVVPGGVHAGAGTFASPFAFDFTVPDIAQLGDPALLDSGDTRISSEPMLRNIGGVNHVYFTHNGGFPSGAPTKPLMLTCEINPAAMPAPIIRSWGYIFGPAMSGGIYQSVAANNQNDLVVGFTYSDGANFASAAVSHFDNGNVGPAPDFSTFTKAGEAGYSIFFGGARNRWGDYSATVVDPCDERTIWSIQEYADTPEPGFTFEGSRWSTWWARCSEFAPSTLSGADCGGALVLECNSSAPPGRSYTTTVSASYPSGSPFEMRFEVDGVLIETRNFAGMNPGPSTSGPQMFTHFYSDGPHTVVITTDDCSGDVSTCTFTLDVVDTTPPVIVCPADIMAECTGMGGAIVNYADPTVTDACDPMPMLTCVPPSGSLFPLGPTVVTCTATDMAGNAAACMFTVTVVDTTPPTVFATVQRPYLFLPRNAMLDVLLQRTIMDLCDPMPVVTVEVWSNQPDTGAPFSPDAAVVGTALQVRAEVDLASADPGRVFLVIVAATDMSGNVGMDCTWAIVPKTVTTTHLIGTRTIAQAAELVCDGGGGVPGGWFNVLPPTPLP